MEKYLNDREFEKFKSLIYNESGINFSDSNRTILESRLKERLRRLNLSDVMQYYSIILKDREELKILLDSVTTNLTRFFRNIPHFKTLENYVIPEILTYKKKSGNKYFRVWSAGCSTGEEPYSIAMVLKDKLPPEFIIEVTGSDLSLTSLMTAKEGYYPDSRINGIPGKYLDRFFETKREGYQIKQEIKGMVKFDYHNLKFESNLMNLDIVFCRNVIIYFDKTAQESVINRFWNVMTGHSYLFIGHSESLFGMNTKFEFVKTGWATIYRKFV
ncbi:MAG: protein-glutamate O-methyltransferase CheR [Spirochaetes bacterium]|nr:protein-glutamate O-methyltransferase CheR [Spirochaetota bacterium]